MLTDDRILDLAEIHCDLDTDSLGRKSFEFDNHGIVAFTHAVEQAAYERAAKACEERAGPIETYNRAYPHYLECAAAIRALAAKESNDADH